MTTSVRDPRSEAPPESRMRQPATVFEAQWRDPERTLVDYLAAAWSRKLWIGISMAVTTFVAVVYALTQPNTYASQASLLVIGNRSGGSAAEVAANMLRTGSIGPSQVLSALEMVNSTVVAQRVVERLTPAVITQPYRPERITEEEGQKMGLIDTITDWMHRIQVSWFADAQTPASLKPEVATEVFRRSFNAWADERASMIKMVYRAGSRTQAKQILDEVVQVVIERHRELFVPRESREWLLQRVQETEAEYNTAKGAYDQFVAANGRVSFTEDITLQERARAATKSTLEAMRRSRDTIRDSLAKYVEQLAKLEPQRTRKRMVSEDSGTARGDLIKDRVRLENLKIDMETREGGREALLARSDRVYQSYVDQLQNVEKRLLELDEPRLVPVVDDDPQYMRVEARISELTLKEGELATEMPRLEAVLSEQDDELKRLYTVQDDADHLVERYTRAKTEWERLRSARDSYEFDAELYNLGLTSLQRVDNPSVPLLKEGPRRTRIIAAGLIAGLLLSVTAIMLLVRMSRAFLRTSEVAVCLGRGDVVGMPWLERGNVRRFRLARKKGWD